MRDFITGLAIIVILVLATALVAPYFVDWNGQRDFLEARLSHALGQKVTIGGNIDVKLLPTPYLVLGQTVIGGDDGPIRIGIRHLDLELSVTPLLHGEVEVVEARLGEPTIRVTLERDRTLPALPDAPAFQANVRFDRIAIADGTLAIADPESGHTFVLDDLDFDAAAASLAGPFKGSGAEGSPRARTKFHFATTAAQKGRARARLVVDETANHAGVDLDGMVALTSAGRATVRQSFDGTVTVSGHLDQAADAPVAWKLSGPLTADPQKATLDAGELRIGGEDAGLTLAATGAADLGATPGLHLDLTAKQLDIDRLAGAPADAVAPPPPKLPDLATMRRALAAATPPLPTTVDLAVDTATWGGETLSDIAAHVGIGGKDGKLSLAGDGPGGSHLGMDGLLAPGDVPAFKGTVDLAADYLPRAIGWLALVDPAVTFQASDLPFRAVKLKARITADAATIDASELALTLDRSALTGTAHVALGQRPAKVTADLKAKALDLDALPDIAALRGTASPFDLDLHLDANAIKVSHIGDGTLAAGHIRVALAKIGAHVALSAFRADNLGGATIDATGSLDPDGATLAMTVDAARLVDAAALAKQLAPGAAAEALVARAPALAPAKLKIDATLTARNGDNLEPSRVKIAGQLGATRIDAGVAPGRDGAVSLNVRLEAPEGSELLRQLGLATLPLDNLGKSRVILSAQGSADQPLDTQVHAAFGATQMDVAGRFALFGAARGGSGTLSLKSPDLSPLLQSLAVAFPDMTGRIPVEAKGGVAFGPEGVALSELKARLAGMAMTGALQWKPRDGDRPAFTGSLAFDRLALADLFGLAVGPAQPVSENAAWSNLTFGAGLVDPPRGVIALHVKSLDLAANLVAEDAGLDLGFAPNLVTLNRLAANLAGGRIASDVTLRRDGSQAALEGKLALDHVRVDLPGLKTVLTAKLDLAGSGSSALGLVSSLAGAGEATWADTMIPGADPKALPRIFAEVENDDVAVDEDSIIRALQETAKVPLDAGTRHFALSLAGGVLHFDAKTPEPPKSDHAATDQTVTSTLDAALDLRRPAFDEHIEETLRALPKNWAGPPPSIVYTSTGSPKAPSRSIDVSGFINAVATRALARESARIEAYEFDIRERAFFNQRLQSERRREQDQRKAEEDARKAEAERKARLEAARLERARKDEAAKVAKEAARERATREKAERDNADREPPDEGSIPKDREREPEAARPPSPPPADQRRFETPQPGSATDPSAAGRY